MDKDDFVKDIQDLFRDMKRQKIQGAPCTYMFDDMFPKHIDSYDDDDDEGMLTRMREGIMRWMKKWLFRKRYLFQR